MNGLRMVGLYFKKGNYKLISLIVILGLACSFYMIATLVKESYSGNKRIDNNRLVVSSISNYSYIEPDIIEQVKHISGITKVTPSRVINIFLSFDNVSKEALGSYEFIIIPESDAVSDLIFQKSLKECIAKIDAEKLICSYQANKIAIESKEIIYQDHEDLPNHISEDLVDGFWKIDTEVLPVKELIIDIDSVTNSELMLKELFKYGLKSQNSERDKLQSFIATEHDIIEALFYVLICVVFIITGQLLKLLFRSRKQNVGIIRILGYSKRTVTLMMLAEYLLIYILSMIVMICSIFLELLILNYGFDMDIILDIKTFFKGYKNILVVTLICGSLINVLLSIYLTLRSNLNIIKTEVKV
ncbi:MAG: hypothetical protein GX237_07815 [Clostridiales bacterium]|nr:hypothetical protein [Clostridiales bacterium]